MYRYEVDSTTRNDIEGVIGRPKFYEDGGKYYIDGVSKDVATQYWDQATDSIVTKTLDEICQDLYSLDFVDKSTEVEYEAIEAFKIADSEKTPAQKILQVAVRRPEGSGATRVTHDFTDKCTWYQEASQVTGETLTDSGDGLTFNSANERWIDLTHGRVYDEDNIADKKIPKIYDNGTEVTSGITIDYDNGDVTFDNSPTGPITADYWYGDSSCYSLIPTAGKHLLIEHAELQFTKDIQINSPISFQIWVYNPADLPNKIKYQEIRYKNFKDVINAANLGTGTIPAVDGFTNEICVFPFNYVTVKALSSSVGAELRVCVDNDEELTGEWGTATFYVMSEDE